MIQLNLLPDVKLEYIKAQRSRRLISTIAIAVAIGSVAILVLLVLANGLQRKHLSDLTKDITKESAQLQQKQDVSRILTVQNQLQSLTALHAGKPAAYRLFTYLNQVTPVQVAINSFNADFTQQTVTIAGSADALASVNKYVDTLKYTTYTTDTVTTPTKAFSNVVLTNFSLSNSSQTGKPASYTITATYDKAIFDITQNAKLSVPTQTTTRASLNQPTDLFEAAPAPAVKGTH